MPDNHFVIWRLICESLKSLTHWGRYNMAAISQTTFLNTFSRMKMYAFWIRFHWMFLKDPIENIGSDNDLAPNRPLSEPMMAWDIGLGYWRIYATLDREELMVNKWFSIENGPFNRNYFHDYVDRKSQNRANVTQIKSDIFCLWCSAFYTVQGKMYLISVDRGT